MNKNILVLFIAIVLVSLSLYYHKKYNEMQNINNPNEEIIGEHNTENNTGQIVNDMDSIISSTEYLDIPVGHGWKKIDKNWNIGFREVLEDSRCPENVVCVVAGSAKVKIQLEQPNVSYNRAYYETLEIGASTENNLKPLAVKRTDAITGEQIGFIITLIELRPYPNTEKQIDKTKDYVGRFKIDPLS